MDIYDGVLSGNKRAVARLITLVEEGDSDGLKIYERLYSKTGSAKIIGVTGPPGAGKSTLLGLLAEKYIDDGFRVGIIAVDPTSPFSGGAVLGDRIRMKEISGREGCFVRSMASRGQLGGLSRGALDAVTILDAAGYDYIFIETVGTGQSEIDIARYSDMVVLVLVPGLGDDIQAFKAGIMEIGDIIVINKSDYDEAENTYANINSMLSLKNGSKPELLFTNCIDGIGIDELKDDIQKLLSYRMRQGEIEERRKNFYSEELKRSLCSVVVNSVIDTYEFNRILNEIGKRNITPHTGAEMLFKSLCSGEWENDL